MEGIKIGIFERIFKSKKTVPKAVQTELINSTSNMFSAWTGNSYENDIYRSAVDAVARNAAKLKGSHIVKYDNHTKCEGDCKLNSLLQVQPNPCMSAFDMIYKLVTHYFLHNNAFAYIEKNEKGSILGIHPFRPLNAQFLQDSFENLYCKFLFEAGKEAILPYADIIHLRRNFNDNDLFGTSNTALNPALELAHTQNEGITASIKSSANIRGILKFTKIMAPEKLKQEKERFIKDYLQITNSGGIVATDQKTEYIPITGSNLVIDEKQIGAIKTKIYDYLGVSERIVNSSYTEDEWAAFYGSTIEPIALQLSLEFTRKILSVREQAFGNQIIFESGRLQFSSNATKINLISQLIPYGLLTINQALEILNLPQVKDGDKRLQTLNVVDAQKANKYQLSEAKEK